MATTYEPIATTTLGSTSGTITFSSIPTTYTDIYFVVNPASGGGTTGIDFSLRFNSDTGTNYSSTHLEAVGSSTTASSGRRTSTSSLYFTNTYGFANSQPTLFTGNVFSYAGSTYKTVIGQVSSDTNATTGTIASTVGLWRSTSAINSITFVANVNFGVGTTATLYGIKAA